jgi:hypothetical protein
MLLLFLVFDARRQELVLSRKPIFSLLFTFQLLFTIIYNVLGNCLVAEGFIGKLCQQAHALMNLTFKTTSLAGHQWLMSVILATWEGEMGRIMV